MIAFVKMDFKDAFDRRTLTDCHDILDCGGKRSATPLSDTRNAHNIRHASPARKRRRRSALPAQSMTPHLAVRTNQCRLVSQTSLTNAPAGSKLSLAFAYDSKCRRIQKLVSTNSGSGYVAEYTNRFAYDGWNLVAILNPASSITASFVWGSDLSGSMQGSLRESGTSLTGGAGGVGGLLEAANYGSSTTNCFTAFDGNGNVSALVNAANGSVLAQYEYGPFGELIRKSGPFASACPFRFSTKYQDDESDLLYYGYRYLNTSTGRWLNRDLIGEKGDKNLYLFARNRALTFYDILGNETAYIKFHEQYTVEVTPSLAPFGDLCKPALAFETHSAFLGATVSLSLKSGLGADQEFIEQQKANFNGTSVQPSNYSENKDDTSVSYYYALPIISTCPSGPQNGTITFNSSFSEDAGDTWENGPSVTMSYSYECASCCSGFKKPFTVTYGYSPKPFLIEK